MIAPPSPIEAIVFDLDGVLIDSEGVWERARRDVVATFGGTYPDGATRAVMGMSAPEWSRYLHDVLGVPLEPERINEEVVARVAASYRESLPLMPLAAHVVEEIAKSYPLAIASSSNRSLIELVLELAEIRQHFRVVVSSEEVARGKPAPDVYVRAAELLGIAPATCVAVEDSTNGIFSATKAGMFVIAIPTADHPPSEQARATAGRTFEHLAILLKWLDMVSNPAAYPERIADEDVVATRALRARTPDGQRFDVVARLGKPMKADVDWCSNFEVLGPDGPLSLEPDGTWFERPHAYRAYGIDTLQALTQAVAGLRYSLERSPIEFSQFDEPGAHNLPIFIMGWSDRMTRHLERLVEAECERLGEMLRDPATRAAAREIVGPPIDLSENDRHDPLS